MAGGAESGAVRARTRFVAHAVFASVTLVLAIWLSTGTMAPYAATSWAPFVLEPCHYLVNIDHYQFEAVHLMLDRVSREQWEPSVVLRRVLFPILAFPFTKLWGFLVGGVIASILIHVAALIGFGVFVRKEIGEAAAITVMWLLATYPGITYWAGLPYSYVVIVPGSLACAMLMYRMERSETVRDAARWSLWLGIIFLGYDLLPFFGAATILRLIVRRKWRAIVPCIVTMLLPTLMLLATFKAMRVDIMNSNTGNYFGAVDAYLHPLRDPLLWGRYLVELPAVFATNFLFSNMLFLPLLFAVALVVARREHFPIIAPVDIAILCAAGAVFLFNNAAPPYSGWQMRGHWIARLYQPVFVAYLMPISRVAARFAERPRIAWRAAVAITVLANASVAFGPVLMNPLAGVIYQRFYVHSPAASLLNNMRRFGRRPLGFCRLTHDRDRYIPPLPADWRPPVLRR